MRTAIVRSVIALSLLFCLSAYVFGQQSLLSRQAKAAYDKRAFADAAPLYLLAAQLEPYAYLHLYNAGCSYALSGQTDLAFLALNAAVKKGWTDKTQTMRDQDLVSLRRDPRWDDLMDLMTTGGGLESNKDAMINDLNNLAAQAYQYFIRPTSMGGGQGSYAGYSIPTKLSLNENASYQVLSARDDMVRFLATSAKGYGTIDVWVDNNGHLQGWTYGGRFGPRPANNYRGVTGASNRDALINHMNNIAAFSYQYRNRPTNMGGGNGSYVGLKLPPSLISTDDGIFRITVLGDVAVQIEAISNRFSGSTITATLDGKGRLGVWRYSGEFH